MRKIMRSTRASPLARILAGFEGLLIAGIGTIGFITTLAPKEQIFGLFQINAFHNIVHIASGALGIIAAVVSQRWATRYLLFVGFAFGALTIFGFAVPGGNFFNLATFSLNDDLLHAAVAASAFVMCLIVLLLQPDTFVDTAGRRL
jgi:arginine exporter protein ArgO